MKRSLKVPSHLKGVELRPTKIRPCERATNRNSYLNIICIKLATQVEKNIKKKTKIRIFDLRFLRPRFLKPTSTALIVVDPYGNWLHEWVSKSKYRILGLVKKNSKLSRRLAEVFAVRSPV